MFLMKEEELVAANEVYLYEMTVLDVDEGEEIRYTAYGVQALDSNGHVIAEFPDVSTSQELVQQVVAKCNQYHVDVLHLEDILLDSIG